MPIKTYKDLNVFRESYRLALAVSRTSRGLPGPEQFELARQLRRAARLVPANIVEGGPSAQHVLSSRDICRWQLARATNANCGWSWVVTKDFLAPRIALN